MATGPVELEERLTAELERLGLAAVPIVLPTGWAVGPVAAFLFPHEPVTLVDAGRDVPEARIRLEEAFRAAGTRIEDLDRILVTHGDSDHFGCAAWLQERSGCEVLLHPDDVDRLVARDWRGTMPVLFRGLGLTEDDVAAYFSDDGPDWVLPAFTPMDVSSGHAAGRTRLSAEHHPGHTPGHVWFVEERTRAMFVGDYLLASSPTSAGLEPAVDDPTTRLPMLAWYEQGLRELSSRDAPVLLPAHGPAIHDAPSLIRRRLTKSDRRTTAVRSALSDVSEVTVAGLAYRMYGERVAANPWGILADVAGRLDLLAARGHASARKDDDGVWRFSPEATPSAVGANDWTAEEPEGGST